VSVQARPEQGLPLCERCAGGATVGEFKVHRPGYADRLDRAGVVALLRSGELRDSDFISAEGESPRPIAAHPVFRDLFLAPAPPTPGRAAGPGWLALLAIPLLGGVMVVLAAGGVWWWWQQPPAADAPVAGGPVAVAPGADAVVAIQAEAGAVAEPVALLLARAWAARTSGDGTAALGWGTRAVARAPDNHEARGLLAALYAEAGQHPDRVQALLAGIPMDAPLRSRAEAEVAAASRGDEAGRAAAASCLSVSPEDLVCLELADRLAPGDAGARLAASTALAERWPQHRGLARRVARLAMDASAPDATARLEAIVARFPGDPELAGGLARLYLHAGDPRAAQVARALGAAAPPDVVAQLAGAAVVAGDVAAARAWVGPFESSQDPVILLRRGQVALLEARARPGDAAAAAAAEAAGLAWEADRAGVGATQLRLLAAIGTRDYAAAQRAYDRVVVDRAGPADHGNLLLARVAVDLARSAPSQARSAAEEAVRADPNGADARLWLASVHLAGDNGPGALAALRSAVAAVDGTRPAPTETVPVPVSTAELTSGLVSLMSGRSEHERDLALALAVLDWLGGAPDRALARVEAEIPRSDDPDLAGLHARLLLGAGDGVGALAAAERAAALAPRQPAWTQLVSRARARGGQP